MINDAAGGGSNLFSQWASLEKDKLCCMLCLFEFTLPGTRKALLVDHTEAVPVSK